MMPGLFRRTVAILGAAALVLAAGSLRAQKTAGGALDPLITDAGFWAQQADAFDTSGRDLGFRWTSAARTSSRSIARGLTFCGRKVGETIVEFSAGKPKAIHISLHNRGDDGAITDRDKFKELLAEWEASLSSLTGSNGVERGRDPHSAVRAEGKAWTRGGTDFILQYSATGGATDFRSEFIRLIVAPAEKTSLIDRATDDKVVRPVARGDLAKNVARKEGDVFIDGIPMIDQGQKGYCVNAAASRVFNYYGIPLTQHEVAQMADTTAEKGTSGMEMVEALKTIARRFKSRLKTYVERDLAGWLAWIKDYNKAAKKAKNPEIKIGNVIDVGALYATANPDLLIEAFAGGSDLERFRRDVRGSIDAGIPMLWTLELGIFPEHGGGRLQARGGHMRLLIGYNQASDEVLFSDSWGRGHELKRMKCKDAMAVTTGLFAILPNR